MQFNFDWNFVASGAPYVTISTLGLGFNQSAVGLLGTPENVVVGFDEENMAIGIKQFDDTKNAGGKPYKFASRIKNGWIRIGCKDFVKYLSTVTGIKFAPAKKYIAQYDTVAQVLYIRIEQKVSTEEKSGEETE